jgi:hypothetical protein
MFRVLILAAGLAWMACGGSDDSADDTPPEGATLEDTVARDTAGDSIAAADPDAGSADDPFTGFQLDADPVNHVERRIALLLRNHDARTAIVYADGGAGEVLLDSVPPGSDIRVDILSRAGTIALRSVTPEGDLLRATEVSPGADTVVGVIVGPPSAP